MTQLGFYFDQTRCIGCYTCSVACKDWHNINTSSVNWLRIRTIERGKFPNLFLAFLAEPCYHCVEPPCVLACPMEAISKRKSDGIVVVDSEKCLGNKECNTLCLNACPWDVPQFGPEEGARIQKCDLCLERTEQDLSPICVEACPMYALDVNPLDELKKRYGENVTAEGFKYSKRFRPSIVFKPKTKATKKKNS
jgi:anaerobic dimethyl sulfoxide reductase subunit B (iron-sulfur subunit)